MSASQRNKGAEGERALCAILSDYLGKSVKRNLGQSRDGGYDIECGPFAIEVKRRKNIAASIFMEQAIEAAGDKTPVVAMREDFGEWLVMFRLPDAIKLMQGEI